MRKFLKPAFNLTLILITVVLPALAQSPWNGNPSTNGGVGVDPTRFGSVGFTLSRSLYNAGTPTLLCNSNYNDGAFYTDLSTYDLYQCSNTTGTYGWHKVGGSGGGGIPYPSAGIAKSTGSAWAVPTYADFVNYWARGACSGFLKSDGTCVNVPEHDITQPPYNLVCDGVTDNTAKLQQIFNDGGIFYASESTGVCAFNSTVTASYGVNVDFEYVNLLYTGSGNALDVSNKDMELRFHQGTVDVSGLVSGQTLIYSIYGTCETNDASDIILDDTLAGANFGATNEVTLVDANSCTWVSFRNGVHNGTVNMSSAFLSVLNEGLYATSSSVAPGYFVLDSMQSVAINGLSACDVCGVWTTGQTAITITNSLNVPSPSYTLNSVNFQRVNDSAYILSVSSNAGAVNGSLSWHGQDRAANNLLDAISGTVVGSLVISHDTQSRVVGGPYGPIFIPTNDTNQGIQSNPFGQLGIDNGFNTVDALDFYAAQQPSTTQFSMSNSYIAYVPGASPVFGNYPFSLLYDGNINNDGTQNGVGFSIAGLAGGYPEVQVDGINNVGIGGTGMSGGGDTDNGDLFVDAGVGAIEKYMFQAPRIESTAASCTGTTPYMKYDGTCSAVYGIVASGTTALATSSIASGTCQTVTAGSVNSSTATGAITSNKIVWTPAVSLQTVIGYGVSLVGGLTIDSYIPTGGGYVNFNVCNTRVDPITPGALTLNWTVLP